jgi:hypothetical protein
VNPDLKEFFVGFTYLAEVRVRKMVDEANAPDLISAFYMDRITELLHEFELELVEASKSQKPENYAQGWACLNKLEKNVKGLIDGIISTERKAEVKEFLANLEFEFA